MRKLGWFAVSVAVAAVIAAGILLLAANLYVQSQGTQQRIRQMLADVLHVPVSLGKTTVSPWSGLRLDGIALQFAPPHEAVPPETRAGTSFVADSFRVRVAWWPLLTRHHVIIDDILLDHPNFSWVEDPGGQWSWPESTSSPHLKDATRGSDGKGAAPPGDPEQGERTEATLPSPPLSDPSSEGHAMTGAGRNDESVGTVPVKKFRVRHGVLDFLNAHHKLLGRLREVNVVGLLHDADHVTGKVQCDAMGFAPIGLRLTNFSSAFHYDTAKGFSIDSGRGDFAGGILQANYALSTQDPDSPFTADCHLKNVDLSELINEAGSPLHLIEGRLEGDVHCQGYAANPERTTAAGQLHLVGARLSNFAPLEFLGEMLRIKDLSHLQFKKAELDCRLDGNHLAIDPLELVSNDLQVSARGDYLTDENRLAIHGKLIIDEAVSHQLPQFIEMNFTSCDDEAPGCRFIEFDVNGPLGKPSTNLFDKVLAGPSTGLLENLLAPKPKKQHAKGPKGLAIPSPTPSSGPDRNL